MKRFVRCKECDACQREDCGECEGCLSAVVENGSNGKAKSKCKLRKCENPQERPPKGNTAPKEIYYATGDKKKEHPYDMTPGATDQFEGFPGDKLPGQRVPFGDIKRKSDKKQWADKHFEIWAKERKREKNMLSTRRSRAKKKSKKAEAEEATNAALEDKAAELEKEKSDLVERNNDLQKRNDLLERENVDLKGRLQLVQEQLQTMQQPPSLVINNPTGPVVAGGILSAGGNISFGGAPNGSVAAGNFGNMNFINGGGGAPNGCALTNGALAAGVGAGPLLLPPAGGNGNDAAAAAGADG